MISGFLASIILSIYIKHKLVTLQEGPYNHDSTASRLLSKVKHDLDLLVLRWGNTVGGVVVCL